VKEVTIREVRLLLPLMALRGLPRRVARRRAFRPALRAELGEPPGSPRPPSTGPLRGQAPSAPVLAAFLRAGFILLGERPGAEIAAGAVGRFWRPAGNQPVALRAREDFVSFAAPGYAKGAMSFLVRPERGGSLVVTETRVAGTSPDATRAFRLYWLAIRLGSGAIRRSWLAAIRRRAIRSAQ
jgi:hypothetical protein